MDKKIAVKVSNQQEYDAFRKHCEEVGIKLRSECNCYGVYYVYEEDGICFTDSFSYIDEYYEIISFQTFAKLKGIDMPKKEVIIQLTQSKCRAWVSPEEVAFTDNIEYLTKQEITEIYSALKSLETH